MPMASADTVAVAICSGMPANPITPNTESVVNSSGSRISAARLNERNSSADTKNTIA